MAGLHATVRGEAICKLVGIPAATRQNQPGLMQRQAAPPYFPRRCSKCAWMPVGSPVTRCINAGGRYREPS
jgi:hypothetical protein